MNLLPSLPLEILIEIACKSPETFHHMLALRPVVEFVRSHREWIISRLTVVERKDGCTVYMLGGKRHREGDLPAVICDNGAKEWWQYGVRHRDNGPAWISSYGQKTWFQRGVIHREDGPAIEYTNGSRTWYRWGKIHRDPKDGYAVEYSNGQINQYWVDGMFIPNSWTIKY